MSERRVNCDNGFSGVGTSGDIVGSVRDGIVEVAETNCLQVIDEQYCVMSWKQ